MKYESITIIKPDDWHLHLRDNGELERVLPYSAKQFGRGLIMPNLKPPVTSTELALAYRDRILGALPDNMSFDPKMTIYLTDETTPQMIEEAAKSPHIVAAKLYPANATTNSSSGVTDTQKLDVVFRAMEDAGIVLCIHGELLQDNIGEVDVFDREKYFITDVLRRLVDKYSKLKIVLEHITTKEAVDFVKRAREGVVATITAHHLLENRNALFRGGIQPHNFCLPVLKRERHQKALIKIATSGNSKFFAGTDSAPHPQGAKESSCGCAGCFTAMSAMELYATVFDEADALGKLEAFVSFYGADFYGLPRNNNTITLERSTWTIPNSITYPARDDMLVPFWAGKTLNWKVKDQTK